jgi:hypothetical protein
MSIVYPLNTLGGQPLVTRSAKYFLSQDLRLDFGYLPPFHDTKHIHNHNVVGGKSVASWATQGLH